MWKMMKATYASFLLNQPILASEEIKNATQAFRSIYESKPSAAHSTYNRCRENLNAVFGEVLGEIHEQWPSKSVSRHSGNLGGSVAA